MWIIKLLPGIEGRCLTDVLVHCCCPCCAISQGRTSFLKAEKLFLHAWANKLTTFIESRHLKSVDYLMDDGDLNRAKSMGADMTRSWTWCLKRSINRLFIFINFSRTLAVVDCFECIYWVELLHANLAVVAFYNGIQTYVQKIVWKNENRSLSWWKNVNDNSISLAMKNAS